MLTFMVTYIHDITYKCVRRFRCYKANVYYNLVLLHLKILIHMFEGILFRQPNNKQPAGAKQAACQLFNARSLRYFLKKKQRAARWRKKASLELSPTFDRSGFFVFFKKSETNEKMNDGGYFHQYTTIPFIIQYNNKV
jgi:hypothetical protein